MLHYTLLCFHSLSPAKMAYPSKNVEVENFQLGNGDFEEENHPDGHKSSAADRRDMARMNKPQEMKVSTSNVFLITTAY